MKRVLAVTILPAAFLLSLCAWTHTTANLASRDALAAADNARHAVLTMRHVQAEREGAALAARIERLSRGLIRDRQARAVAEVMDRLCDERITEELIVRLIQRESRWTPHAIGASGEHGLMQLKPSTAKLPAHALLDPVQNIEAGIGHLRDLVERTGSLPLALAAYNGGLYAGPIRYARAVMGGERP